MHSSQLRDPHTGLFQKDGEALVRDERSLEEMSTAEESKTIAPPTYNEKGPCATATLLVLLLRVLVTRRSIARCGSGGGGGGAAVQGYAVNIRCPVYRSPPDVHGHKEGGIQRPKSTILCLEVNSPRLQAPRNDKEGGPPDLLDHRRLFHGRRLLRALMQVAPRLEGVDARR